MRGVSHTSVPECFGRADCMGCLWREECVRATLGKRDRRYGPRKRRNAPVGSRNDAEGTIADGVDQVPMSDCIEPQRRL